jgi:CoA-binding domain
LKVLSESKSMTDISLNVRINSWTAPSWRSASAIRHVNATPSFLYRVTEVVVFGSYLSIKSKLGDVDLAIHLDRSQNRRVPRREPGPGLVAVCLDVRSPPDRTREPHRLRTKLHRDRLDCTGGVPAIIYLLDLMICFLATAGVRVMVRMTAEATSQGRNSATEKQTLVYGAGDAGVTLLREIQKNPKLPYRVRGFLDDRPDKKGVHILGAPVLGGGDQVEPLVTKHNIDIILIAIPSATGPAWRRTPSSLFPCLSKNGDGHCPDIVGRETHRVADRVSEPLCPSGCCNGRLERVFEFGDARNGGSELGLERGRRAAIHSWLRFVESRCYGSAADGRLCCAARFNFGSPRRAFGRARFFTAPRWNDLESGGRWHWLQPTHFPFNRTLLAIPGLALANGECFPGSDLQFDDAARGLGLEVHEAAIGEGVEHLGSVAAVNVTPAVKLESDLHWSVGLEP